MAWDSVPPPALQAISAREDGDRDSVCLILGGHDDARKSAQTILGSEKCALNLVCPVMGSGKRALNPVCLILGSEYRALNLVCLVMGSGKRAPNLVCLVMGSGKRAPNSVCPIVGSEYRALNPVCPVPGVWVACPRFRADRHYPHVGLSALRAAHPYPMNDAPDASGAPLRRKGYGFLLRQANKFERASIAREWAGVFMVSLILHIRLSYSFRLVLSFSPNFCCRSESEAGTGTGIRPAPVRDWLFLY